MHLITGIHPGFWDEALLSAGHQEFRLTQTQTQPRPSNSAPAILRAPRSSVERTTLCCLLTHPTSVRTVGSEEHNSMLVLLSAAPVPSSVSGIQSGRAAMAIL